ncbi:hypothetical protein PVAP13_7KG031327 [Panicum virgatum]|uniref:Uncharacterized protein n=1 Tax=Panicum virgatum TaxID=38727 RepID=A0A8T0QC21_PANVG|nr:hypothetical protein PVAP13_7KG031327 [Panicum virgatum]
MKLTKRQRKLLLEEINLEEDANADTAAQNLSPNTNISEDVVHAGIKRGAT